jgi:predicted molibdopterin-dependent oxidoreductase YjgC
MNMRVTDHVILGPLVRNNRVKIIVDGRTVQADEGEPILAALLAENIVVNRYTVKRHEPRGLFCGIGQCTDCVMIVNGKANVRTCITPVEEGMVVKTQYGVGDKADNK